MSSTVRSKPVLMKALTGQAAIEHEAQIRAKNLLNLKIESDALGAAMDSEKAWFRDYANGETSTTIVEGYGLVKVSRPAEASSGTSFTFNASAFQLLPKKKQEEIIKLGLVTVAPFHKPAGTASVTVTPNK